MEDAAAVVRRPLASKEEGATLEMSICAETETRLAVGAAGAGDGDNAVGVGIVGAKRHDMNVIPSEVQRAPGTAASKQ